MLSTWLVGLLVGWFVVKTRPKPAPQKVKKNTAR
jgi:hypothetical protein